VIYWKDFYFDQVLGPILVCEDDQRKSAGIMDDAHNTIQETRHQQQPARMVGGKSLDFQTTDMDVQVEADSDQDFRNRGINEPSI